MKPGVRAQIEQAIARGWPVSRIMADLDVPYSLVRDIADHQTLLAADPPKAPTVTSQLMVNGRPYSSYFGPAHPDVIEALIDAVCPTTSRRKKAA